MSPRLVCRVAVAVLNGTVGHDCTVLPLPAGTPAPGVARVRRARRRLERPADALLLAGCRGPDWLWASGITCCVSDPRVDVEGRQMRAKTEARLTPESDWTRGSPTRRWDRWTSRGAWWDSGSNPRSRPRQTSGARYREGRLARGNHRRPRNNRPGAGRRAGVVANLPQVLQEARKKQRRGKNPG